MHYFSIFSPMCNEESSANNDIGENSQSSIITNEIDQVMTENVPENLTPLNLPVQNGQEEIVNENKPLTNDGIIEKEEESNEMDGNS